MPGRAVLHVEDDADYAEMFQLQMRRQARKAGSDPLMFETVPTLQKAYERCDDRAYDCVVCDYQLPDGNGLDFLGRYRSLHTHRPLIFLTGQGDESVARLAFKMGANDYFTKDDGFAVYERIYNAICTQIRHFEEGRVRRETERKLRSEQEWARTYFRLADVLMMGYDAAGTITHINDAGQRILGYSCEELHGVPFVCELHPPYEREDVRDVLERLRTSPPGTVITNENDMVTKDGKRRTFLWRNSAIFDEKGRITGFLASGMDITERTRQEMRIRHLNRLLDAMRSVNQLIAREQDASTLLQRACDIMVTSHGYADIHIALFNEDGSCRDFSPSSPGSDTPDMRKSLETKTLPPCMKRAMDQDRTVVVCRPDDICRTCAICDRHDPPQTTLVHRLSYAGRDIGVIFVRLASDCESCVQDVELFDEMAHDLSFALHSLELKASKNHAEKQLREDRTYYRTIMEASPIGIVTLDRDGRITHANTEAQRITGRSLETLKSMSFDDSAWDIKSNDGGHIPSSNLPFSIVRDRLRPVYDVRHTIRKDDTSIVLSINASPILDEHGLFRGMVATLTDKTSEMSRNDILTKMHQLMNEMLTAMDDHFYVVDSRYRIVMSNQLGCNYLPPDKRSDSFLCYRMIKGRGVPCDGCPVAEIFCNGMRSVNEHVTDDGSTFEVRYFPIFDDNDDVALVSCLSRDVSSFRELDRAHREKERILTHFSHVVSHHLKNYLAAIRCYAELQAEEGLGKEYAPLIIAAVDRMNAYVNSQLHLATAGKPVDTFHDVGLRDLLEKVADSYPLSVVVGDVPHVRGDPQRIEEVFSNLIHNAWKNGNAGRVEIFSTTDDEGIHVFVADDGHGIPPERTKRLFDKTQLSHGSGLGLLVAQEVMHAHGGSIRLKSTGPEGTVMELVFLHPQMKP